MEREIKFRALRRDNSKMIYGCCGYGFSQKIEYIMPSMYFATRDFGEVDEKGNPIIEDEIALGGFIPIIPETVGQYVGLKDKNGKEIYEGDIVTSSIPCDFDLVKKYIVGYYNATFVFFKTLNDKYPIRQWNDGSNDWHSIENIESFETEIIGNIYENPEMLK